MNDITALAQRMKEIDPRDEFEKLFPLPVFCIRCGTGYASTAFNGWDANKHQARWEGWKAAMALMESRTVIVKLPEEAIDQVCLAAAEIHNRGNGVSDDKAQFIINRIRNYLENGGELKGAGLQVIEGDATQGA